MRSKVQWILLGGAFAISASLPVPQALTLNGRPFPAVAPYIVRIPFRHTVSVSPADDVQAVLRRLTSGDQLNVKAGRYPSFSIDEQCHDGPIVVIFDPKAMVAGSVAIQKSNWHIDRARVQGGVKITGQDVTISNSRIKSDSVGIDIAPGARHITIANNYVYDSPGGDIRVNGVRDVDIIGNTIRRGSAGIAIANTDNVKITDNTIDDTRAIALEQVRNAIIRMNHIADAPIAIAVGRLSLGADDVTIDHNDIETTSPAGVAVSIEAGNHILFANNVIDGYADGVLLLGRPRNVTVVNNLILGMTGTAFVIHDLSSIRLFDFNVFSPASDAVKAEIGSETLTLAQSLARAKMPNTRQVSGVHLLQRDLGRIAGVETVDRGTSVGIEFKGRAPDLGVGEQ
jgi:parallel beta-helix repeat protein